MERDLPSPYSKQPIRPDRFHPQRIAKTPSPAKDEHLRSGRSPARNRLFPTIDSRTYSQFSSVTYKTGQPHFTELDSISDLKGSAELTANRVPDVKYFASNRKHVQERTSEKDAIRFIEEVNEEREGGSSKNSLAVSNADDRNKELRQSGHLRQNRQDRERSYIRLSQGQKQEVRSSWKNLHASKEEQRSGEQARVRLAELKPNVGSEGRPPKRKIFESGSSQGQNKTVLEMRQLIHPIVPIIEVKSEIKPAEPAASSIAVPIVVASSKQVVSSEQFRRPSPQSKHRSSTAKDRTTASKVSPLKLTPSQPESPSVEPFTQLAREMGRWSGPGEQQPLFVLAKSEKGQDSKQSEELRRELAVERRLRGQAEQKVEERNLTIGKLTAEVHRLQQFVQTLQIQNIKLKSNSDSIVSKSLATENKLLKEELLSLEKKAMVRSKELQGGACEEHLRDISGLKERVKQLQGELAFEKELTRALELSNETKMRLIEREQGRERELLLRLRSLVLEAKECYRIGDIKYKLAQIEQAVAPQT